MGVKPLNDIISTIYAPTTIQPVREEIRSTILQFEEALAQLPGALFDDAFPLKHSFTEGCYVREIFIPKGFVLTGKIHKHAHPNFLMQGEVIVITEYNGIEYLKAPLSIISQAGTKRVVIALEDTWWIVVHVTDETNIDTIEQLVIAKDFNEYTTFIDAKTATNTVAVLKELAWSGPLSE